MANLFLISILLFHGLYLARSLIPAKYVGFPYGQNSDISNSIIVEAFFDPLCPDSKDAWPPLKQIFHEHYPHIYLLEKYYNGPTKNSSRAAIVEDVARLGAQAVGNDLSSEFKDGFADHRSDLATRTSFKYGCTRGVFGTPFFFVNGFLLPDGGSAIGYGTWKSIIDPLLGNHGEGADEPASAF